MDCDCEGKLFTCETTHFPGSPVPIRKRAGEKLEVVGSPNFRATPGLGFRLSSENTVFRIFIESVFRQTWLTTPALPWSASIFVF